MVGFLQVSKRWFCRHVIWIIMLIYAIIFLLSKSPNDPYDRLIINDGKAYYAYLPAIFIYQDLTYGFVEYYESKYYPSDTDPSYFKEFRFDYKGKTVNKAFAGIAVLMLPFFLLAHLIALLLGQADGYSLVYQYAIGASVYFYLWLGLIILRKLLRAFSDNELHISFVLLSIAVGTNLVYYTVVEGTMPHVYLFFLVNLFLLLSYRAMNEHRAGVFISASIIFGLILISRPQNGFIAIALPFLAGNPGSFALIVKTLLKRNIIIKVVLALVSVLMLQVSLWYVQTGYMLVYSYGNESFDFFNPQLINLLWSYEKGWMIYTPLAFLGFAGLVNFAKRSIFQASFALITFIVLAYVISCWWVWHYTSQFGQRVFIDFYGLLAILLLAGFTLAGIRLYRLAYISLIFILIVLNLFQFFQHRIWVYPSGPVTQHTYWSNFFRVYPQIAVTIPDNMIESSSNFSFPVTDEPLANFRQGIVLKTCEIEPYAFSKLFSIEYGRLSTTGEQILKISTNIWDCSSKELSLHAEFYSGGKKYSDYTWRIDSGLRCEKLNPVEVAVQMPFAFTQQDSACIYFYSPVAQSIGIGNSVVQIINLKSQSNARWINQPLNTTDKIQTVCFDLESNNEIFKPGQLSTEVAHSGSRSIRIDSLHSFGATFNDMADQFFTGENRALQVSFATYSTQNVKDAVLVITQSTDSKVLAHEEIPLVILASDGTWIQHQYRKSLPVSADLTELHLYIRDKSAQSTWYVDDFCIHFITLTDRVFTVNNTLDQTTVQQPNVLLNDTVLINSTNQFYGLPFLALSSLTGCLPSNIFVSASVLTDVWFPGISLVVSHYHGKEIISYDGRYFSVHTLKNRWRELNWEFRADSCLGSDDTLRIYFWNPVPNEQIWITNFALSVTGREVGSVLQKK